MMQFDIVQSDSNLATIPANSPMMSMALGLGPQDLQTVPTDAGITSPEGGGQVISPQGPNNDLASLRSRFPFLPIMPIPTEAAAVILNTAVTQGGVTYYIGEMRIPDGAVLGMFLANDEIYCSRLGNAEVPSVYNTNDFNNAVCKSFMVSNGDQAAFYVGGVKSLSFASPSSGAVISAMFYAPDQYPR